MQHTITKMYYEKKLIKYCKSYICLTANIYLTTIHGRIPMLGATGISKCAMRMMFSLQMLVSHTMTNRYGAVSRLQNLNTPTGCTVQNILTLFR